MSEEKKLEKDDVTDHDSTTSYSGEKVDFKVYDMPVELKNKYISLAKLEHDNQMWKVLEEGFKLMMEERRTWKEDAEKEIESLKAEVQFLKTKVENLESRTGQETGGGGPPKTFGGENTGNDSVASKLGRKQ